VAHHAIKHFRNRNVGLVVGRDDLACRAVLTLFVRHLTDVLGQLVDGQAWPRIDRLTLHRTTGRQHVSGPLPLVVGRARHKTQVV